MDPLAEASPPHERQTSSSDRVTIPIIEETATVSRRQVTTGTARIHVTVSEHDETVEALLRQQDVTIDRVAIGTQIDTPPQTRREGDTLIVPILEERLVVEKRLFLKEELRIRIGEIRQPANQAVRLRREHAEIVRDDLAPATIKEAPQ